MKKLLATLLVLPVLSCAPPAEEAADPTDEEKAMETTDFRVSADRFADIEVLRYRVPGFDELSLQQKKLAYYLYEAALSGRDIIWDQNYAHNLEIRQTLEAVIRAHRDRLDDEELAPFVEYTKRVWFANGIHHHYASTKFQPGFDPAAFRLLVAAADPAQLPLREGETLDDLLARLEPIVFDPTVAPKKVDLSPDVDQVKASATNFYRDVTQEEVESFYAAKVDPGDATPVSWGLNSQLAKENGELVEKVWKVGGMYGPALEQVVHWLSKAVEVAETDSQKQALEHLVRYFETGDLRAFDDYNIAWVEDTEAIVDTVNGFIEVYGDPLGFRGSYESIVSIKDLEATRRIATLAENAQWFEDESPLQENHKKENVVGISAKVITIVVESGDAAPSTPIGINLPNANWIRKEHGSKSVTLGNIIESYNAAAAASGLHEEFMLRDEEKARFQEYGELAYNLDVDLHEVIGHASGQLEPGVGTPKETLKSYASTLEEARADLVALYYIIDPKLVELGLVPSTEVGKVTYDRFVRNGLMIQLYRLELGDDIEEAHMRNRQLIAGWAYERGLEEGVIERVEQEGKTYFVVRDYDQLRELFGQLLREIQRIKSQGDYEAGKELVETYGVKVDRDLHEEVLARVEALDIAPYKGFLQPRLVPVEEGGEIVDVEVEYPDSFVDQMLELSERYGYLEKAR